jgi:hypothetical protein
MHTILCLEIVIVSIMLKEFQIENSKYCTINHSFGLFVRSSWSELMKFSLFLTNTKSILQYPYSVCLCDPL